MVQEELSKLDKKRILGCDNYSKTKEIMAAHEKYKDLPLGEVYFIKSMGYDGKWRYENRGYNSKPSKFMIFYKDDDGFVFMKRINADGKLGVEITCLTTQYSNPSFIIEPDPEFVEAIIFENTESYDPLKAEKDYNKKKGKASRKNKKLEIKFETPLEAYNYIKTLSIGDKLWDAHTSFGSGLCEYTVTSVDKTPVLNPGDLCYNRYDRENKLHQSEGFVEKIIINMQSSDSKHGVEVSFYNFWKNGYRVYYGIKPFTPEDF